MRILYNIVFFIFGVFYLPYLVFTRRYRYGMKDRFGILPEKIKNICSKNKIIWVHAVSLGEAKTAGILAPLLRKAYPGHKIVFSTVTYTGNKAFEAIAASDEGVFYLPLDLSFIVDRVVKLIKPEMFILLETELWPNLIYSIYESGSRLVLVNGRISNRSYPGYKKSRYFVSGLLKKFSLILMQSDMDAERIITLGAPKEKVFVTGNLKFDILPVDSDVRRVELRKKMNINEDEILIVAGSTHKGEEEILAGCFLNLKKDYPYARLLIAPRHIERVREIEKIFIKFGFKTTRISSLSSQFSILSSQFSVLSSKSSVLSPQLASPDFQTIFILDTMGELKSMYAASDIVFVGKSLIKKGGQNPIEPASLGKPVIFGRHMFNFQDAVKILLEHKSALEVEGPEGLYSAIKFLLDNPGERKKLGISAKEAVSKNSGSCRKTIDLILK